MAGRISIVADRHIPFLEGVFEPYADIRYMDGSAITAADVRTADALITRTRTRCDEALLANSGVSLIATATIGTDHIDLGYCEKRGIKVCNAAGCNAGGVMQYVFTAIYAAAERRGISLVGASIGIVGAGHVGGKVEEMAKRLGFRVLVCDPPRAEKEGPEGFCTLGHLLESSDIVTLHTPLDETTAGMAGERFFEAMRPGAFFINAARGGIADEKALLEAVPKLGPVIIDTWKNEPAINRELLQAADIATPHIAGYSYRGKQNGTAAAVRSVAEFFGIDALKDFFPPCGNPELLPAAVNFTGLSQGETNALLQSFYPIFADDAALRKDPAGFERQRSEYAWRREFRPENNLTHNV